MGLNSILIPAYALELGASALEMGLIVGSRGIGHFALVVPVSFLLERFGARPLFLVSSFLEAIFILAVFFVGSPLPLLLLATLDGFMCSTRLTVLNTAFLQLLPRINPAQNGWFKACMTSGLMLAGPAAGGILAAKIGLAAAFVINAAVIFATIVLVILLPADFLSYRKRSDNVNNVNLLSKFLKLLRDRKILFIAAGETLNTGYMSSFRTLIILVVVGLLKLPVDIVAQIVLVGGGANILTTFAGPVLLKNCQTKTYYHITVLGIVPALVLLGAGGQSWMLYLGSLLSGVSIGVMSLANYKMMSTVQGDRGLIAGVFTFSAGFSLAVAPMVSSILADYFNVRTAFLAYIIPFGVLEGVLWLYRSRAAAGEPDNSAPCRFGR